ncbi:Fibroblast growth factor 18 [Orchesella cincta]|uniref:Fibroblast growth factor 18 n=1 Tax=Orchesella cincta TaxID=48709 RepID=A0A1D2N4W7_ORCCI|nr:Fibroblast growth factor 18 [Orchesella cincta]
MVRNFEFEIAGENGEMRIKAVITGFYVTMTPKGRIVGQPQSDINGTVWIETRVSSSSAYMSFLSRDYAHLGWYFAIKKSGKPKAGHKTNHPYPQKSISFLTYIVSEEFY